MEANGKEDKMAQIDVKFAKRNAKKEKIGNNINMKSQSKPKKTTKKSGVSNG